MKCSISADFFGGLILIPNTRPTPVKLSLASTAIRTNTSTWLWGSDYSGNGGALSEKHHLWNMPCSSEMKVQIGGK